MYRKWIKEAMTLADTNFKVFLGGTCNESDWRERLIPLLDVDYFNPVVPDWTPECQEEELRQREICDLLLYVITPKMKGVYSIAEVVDDSNKQPEKTIFCLLSSDGGLDFLSEQINSLNAVSEMVVRNGGQFFTSLEACADFINS